MKSISCLCYPFRWAAMTPKRRLILSRAGWPPKPNLYDIILSIKCRPSIMKPSNNTLSHRKSSASCIRNNSVSNAAVTGEAGMKMSKRKFCNTDLITALWASLVHIKHKLDLKQQVICTYCSTFLLPKKKIKRFKRLGNKIFFSF